MPAIVVVALPEKDELVNELSSETKAHMTLLYLDAPMGVNEEHIVQFVQHATDTSLVQFGMSVEKRGTLGPDDADVLFFEQEYGGKTLRDFRAELLKDDTIAEHYVKTDQFPGWVPHLTMGYPAKPAKEVPKDDRYALKWINFDRIAVWLSDYDGPEFELRNHPYATIPEAVWSEDYGVHLMHYGRLGMRWGIRRETNSSGLVTGSVSDAIKKGQSPHTDFTGSSGKVPKGKQSVDHKKLQKNLKKDVATLSTAEIKQITARVKAVNEFKAVSKAQQEAKRSLGSKLAKWAINAVVAGAKQTGESYIKEVTGDTLRDILPKTKTQTKKDQQEQQKKANDSSKQDAAAKQREREKSVRDLSNAIVNADGVYNVTTLPRKED